MKQPARRSGLDHDAPVSRDATPRRTTTPWLYDTAHARALRTIALQTPSGYCPSDRMVGPLGFFFF